MTDPISSVRDSSSRYQDGAYLAENPSWGVEDSAWKAEIIDQLIQQHRLSPNTVCEVGCGAGEILNQLSLRHSSTLYTGYEVSPQAYELCLTRTRSNLRFILDDLNKKDVHFDLLLCIDVFEHIEDYLGFIKTIQTKASYKVFHIPLDLSVLSILTGSIMTARHRLGHLHYFSKDTALATLRDAGYEIISWQFATAFSKIPAKSWRAQVAKWPRILLHAFSPNLSAKLLGGSSLLVLAK
jgi:hypothetical protein